MNCPKCNSEKIIEGMLTSMYSVVFTQKGTEGKLFPRSMKIECMACEDCGNLFDFHVIIKKKKIKEKK